MSDFTEWPEWHTRSEDVDYEDWVEFIQSIWYNYYVLRQFAFTEWYGDDE